MDVLITLGAWRLATEIAGRFPAGHITSGEEPTHLVVRAGAIDIATFDLTDEAELRSMSLPPVPASEWAWPMRHADLRHLAFAVIRGFPRRFDPEAVPPRGRLEGLVIVRILDWLAHTGLELEVVDVRRHQTRVPEWLAARDDVEPLLHEDERWALWVLRIGPDVVAALHAGWLFTPAGETVNLYARYLAGASIHELGEIVIGHKLLPEELPPYTTNVDRMGLDEDQDRRIVERARRAWATQLRRPQGARKERPDAV